MQAATSSALTWMIGTSKPLARSEAHRRRARVVGVGGEADLVVLDDVDRAADRVAVERLQVERLGDDALAREGGVAVQDDRDRGVGVLVGVRALAGRLRRAGGAGRHRADELQVRRVGLQADDDRLAARQLVGALGAVVVLDVAGAALGQRGDRLERRGALELGEDRLVAAAEVVGEHVQAAAVGHADHDLARAAGGGQLGQLVEHRHRHVQALDRELLLAQVGLVHEALEGVDLGQPLEQRLLLVAGQRVAELAGLDRLAQPQPLAVRGDVLDLVGDRPAVGLAQVGQRVGQGRARARTCAGRATGIRAISSGVRPSGSGSSAGSPSGSRPSGSSLAARWPCVRWALSSEVAAWTA